jgi:hypothetical protein
MLLLYTEDTVYSDHSSMRVSARHSGHTVDLYAANRAQVAAE